MALHDVPITGLLPTPSEESIHASAEESSRADNAFVTAILDETDHGIVVLDDDMRLRLWNQRAVEMLGIPQHQRRVGCPLAELIAHFHRHQGASAEDTAETVAARLRDFKQDHVVTLPANSFNGRVVERRRRALPGGGMVLTYIDVTEAKRREDEIAASRAFLAATLDNMDQGILVLDSKMNIRLWNQRTIDLIQLPPNFLSVGQPMAELLHFVGTRFGRTEAAQEKRTAEVLAEFRRERSIALDRLNPNGLVLGIRSQPMPDGGVVITYTDITTLAQRERMIDEQRRLLAAALSNMEQGILVLDDDLNVLTWNERIVQMFDLPADFLRPHLSQAEIIRFMVRRSGHSPEHADRIVAARLDTFRNPEMQIVATVKSDRIIERRSRPLASGGYVVMYTDVTAQRRHEQEIAEKSLQLTATLANMDQALIVIDAADRVMLWNDRITEMFAIPPALMQRGALYADILRHLFKTAGTPPERIEAAVAARIPELRASAAAIVDIPGHDGRVFERRARVMADGGLVITYSDVTERRQAEAEAVRAREEAELASRTKTEFLANMSHELRTPLNAIIGFSDVLNQEIFGPLGSSRYKEYARDVRESGAHLLSLINDVLDVAKVEVNKVELHEELVDGAALVDACMRLIGERARVGHVTLRRTETPDLPSLWVDERRVKQIVLNLLSNAVKFTPSGGRAEVHIAADPSGYRIAVTDTGIGIAPQDIERALTPFGQIDSRLARRYEGTGLGLPLARSMIELHGGRMEIASEPSHGTQVTVWFPPDRMRATAREESATAK